MLPTYDGDQLIHLVDARLLHRYLGVRRDFSTWIKGRIRAYGFEKEKDYFIDDHSEDEPDDFLDSGNSPQACDFDSPDLVNQKNRGGDHRSIDYYLKLDMAKELAMVERTPQGRQARRYFIECERKLLQIQQRELQQRQQESMPQAPPVQPKLTSAERHAINRQAWADVSGQAYAAFHARQEELIASYTEAKKEPKILPPGFRPTWAR